MMTNKPDKPLDTLILIVEDEASIRMGLSAAMTRQGYRVITAENGSDATLKAKENLPDLVISDVMMPVLDGFEMKKQFSSDPLLASIPLIYLTARTTVDDRVAGIRGGADDYITKPFEIDELTARVDAVLRRVHGAQKLGHDEAMRGEGHDIEKLRRELMQNFHHEIRTPLSNVMMFLEIAANHKFETPEEQREFIRIARSSGDRLEAVISDIILLTDLDQCELNYIRQTVNRDVHILQRIKRRLPRYEYKALNFVPIFSITNEINAPRHELTQAILHLVDNALKFSPEHGTVILKIKSTANGGAVITIEDQGPGIPMAYREKVFDRYFQVSQGATRDYQGLGLGLTIARAVFHSLGGEVTILDSAAGCSIQAVLPDLKADDVAYG